MKAVARGERRAPVDAGKPSFSSVEALVRLLTPENRRLPAIIRGESQTQVGLLSSV
jgi:predicted transcriptional regulator